MKKNMVHEGLKRPETYRKLLLAKKAEVLSSLGIQFDTLAGMGRVNEEDQAQITHDEFISLHLNSMEYNKLREVMEALDRLQTGDFGVCFGCGEPIPAKRLDALPWAKYCIHCQSELQALPPGQNELDLAVPAWR